MKAYRLSNGVVLETEAELKAYVRGLETARANPETLDGVIEEAHVVKAAGPKTEEELSQEAAAAAAPAAEEAKADEAGNSGDVAQDPSAAPADAGTSADAPTEKAVEGDAKTE